MRATRHTASPSSCKDTCGLPLFFKSILFFQSFTTAARPVKNYRHKVWGFSATSKLSQRTSTSTEVYDYNFLLLLLLHRLPVFAHKLRLRMRRYRSVVRKIDRVRSPAARHRFQPRLVVRELR